MNTCQNCGKQNTVETNFCRFCGIKLTVQPQPMNANPYESAPRPYAWKTDEFQTQNEARATTPGGLNQTAQFNAAQSFRPAPPAYSQPQHLSQSFRCPNCMSTYPPRMERCITTGGWITFAVLLVVFFPLFWIGLLIKEDVAICQTCNTKLSG